MRIKGGGLTGLVVWCVALASVGCANRELVDACAEAMETIRACGLLVEDFDCEDDFFRAKFEDDQRSEVACLLGCYTDASCSDLAERGCAVTAAAVASSHVGICRDACEPLSDANYVGDLPVDCPDKP